MGFDKTKYTYGDNRTEYLKLRLSQKTHNILFRKVHNLSKRLIHFHVVISETIRERTRKLLLMNRHVIEG